ncbi:di-trans,poly-cis-decaprenylcistransferase [Candidatus Beckwithbacteria bacterium RIFCSPLOWO2_02_FULL_49_12]|nr:MAG: di-trans,poly-cis-decaprenylcistransferase, undecaprenyl diphosphate synthase [Candidatus Beckwithbacteria bacterium GW2011_GWC1_49_16]OGD50520.1 MAG: di-trans,poly-cis-decaprenylcistransferase [Candidatus Beckwithbacteria bacterium RIFCSPHIGHO2_02_FULL_49_13]OGD51584.1 MAG: di-trans,poly-cis-decaprenylcistransferase [Candidatus Beckwithbacteria bacterium RIFCSPHIGHO2_12_FULL_49_13]OGD57900.1 MAG: di-trans,poly-cis-decaprenylcistransferase [Candidatus Beckwithbacteria bacterium RIFCSPLOW
MTLPRHIAIIADGNRRWAKLKNLPEFSGHEHAVRVTMESLVDRCIDLKIPYLTFWVFSTENWRRGKTWVDRYFKLLRSFFNENVDKYQKKGAKLNLIGDLTKLPPDIKKSLEDWRQKSKDNQKITVTIAINYGGRDEILRAIKKFVNELRTTNYELEKFSEENFSNFLDTHDLPDPDLLIRPGGHSRFSGFMLYQAAYAQLYFTATLFPDFDAGQLDKVLDWYAKQQQNLGK